jgi:hypothetical protein
MSKNSWPMLRKFGPPLKPISGKGTTDRPRTIKDLSNVPRKAPDPGQLEARDSPTKDSGSQTRSTLNGRVITSVYDAGNPATMHQPAQQTLQLRTPDRDNQGRLRRHSLPLYSTLYGRTSENTSANETGFNQLRPRLVTNPLTTLIAVTRLMMRRRSQKTKRESSNHLSTGL